MLKQNQILIPSPFSFFKANLRIKSCIVRLCKASSLPVVMMADLIAEGDHDGCTAFNKATTPDM